MPAFLRHRTIDLLSRFLPLDCLSYNSSSSSSSASSRKRNAFLLLASGGATGNVHDLARIGGVSLLRLPHGYAPCDLTVPTRFAATAQFLVDFCLSLAQAEEDDDEDVDGCDRDRGGDWEAETRNVKIPGLFRIPGSKVTTERLRGFFERQLLDGRDALNTASFSSSSADEGIAKSWLYTEKIEYTVRPALLPSQAAIPYNVHDVASCFKSFLGDLEGGILGSLQVFEGLRKTVFPAAQVHARGAGRRRSWDGNNGASLDFHCVGISPSRHYRHGQADFDADGGRGADVNPMHIARVLVSIPCAAQRNLILSFFGILCFFASPSPCPPNHPSSPKDPSQPARKDGRTSQSPCHPSWDGMKQSCFASSPSSSPAPASSIRTQAEALMTASGLGKIFAPILLGRHEMAQIQPADYGYPHAYTRVSPRKAGSKTPSPSKRGIGDPASAPFKKPCSPRRRGNLLRRGLSEKGMRWRSENTFVTVNISSPSPPGIGLGEGKSRSSPIRAPRAVDEEGSAPAPLLTAHHPAPRHDGRRAGPWPFTNRKGSAPLRTGKLLGPGTATGPARARARRGGVEEGRWGELRREQERVLLIADVIAAVVESWVDVVGVLRRSGYGAAGLWGAGAGGGWV